MSYWIRDRRDDLGVGKYLISRRKEDGYLYIVAYYVGGRWILCTNQLKVGKVSSGLQELPETEASLILFSCREETPWVMRRFFSSIIEDMNMMD